MGVSAHNIKMFSRATILVPCNGAQLQSDRGMATLKAIALRLKSVKNIQKITQSMKMVSAAKYSRAERELKPARVYGAGNKALLDQTEIIGDESKPNHLYVAVSSDRGLCGGIHSGIAKALNANIAEKAAGVNTSLI